MEPPAPQDEDNADPMPLDPPRGVARRGSYIGSPELLPQDMLRNVAQEASLAPPSAGRTTMAGQVGPTSC